MKGLLWAGSRADQSVALKAASRVDQLAASSAGYWAVLLAGY